MVQTRVRSDCVPCILLILVQVQTKLAIYVSCIRSSVATCRLGLWAPLVTRNLYYDFFILFFVTEDFWFIDCFGVVYQIN